MKKYLFFLINLIIISSCTDEKYEAGINNTKNIIRKSDPIFNDIIRVINADSDPLASEVCVEFEYPFTLYVYNENYEITNTYLLNGDDMFKNILNNLSYNQSISISYPLQTVLPDGTLFSVNNNDELKTALDFCSVEDIIHHCNGNFCNPNSQVYTCWVVPFIEGEDNTFAGAKFTPSSTGSLSIYHLNNNYTGTWSFIHIGDNVYFNIHIIENSDIKTAWSFNYEIITLTDDKMVINSNNQIKQLEKFRGTNQTYSVGNPGPKAGIVVYDKGSYTDGWRYIELADRNLPLSEWGCVNSTIPNAGFDNIGSGLQNNYAILNSHNDLNNYYTNPSVCSNLNNGTVAPKNIINQFYNNSKEWFVPSFEELELIYNNVSIPQHLIFQNYYYWSSTESDFSEAKVINLQTGATSVANKNSHNIKTITIRYF